jgi:hypothetical protein
MITTGSVKAQYVCLPMTDRDVDSRSGSRHYGRWLDRWHPEDHAGALVAVFMVLFILAGLIIIYDSAKYF